MKKIFLHIIFLVTLVAYMPHLQAEVRARIEGLESNTEYMELLRQERSIVSLESALTEELKVTRKLYNEGGDDTSEYRDKIIKIEQSLIDLSVEKNAIVSKINSIEQRWSIEQVNKPRSTPSVVESSQTESQDLPSSEDAVRIVRSEYAKATLSTMDIKNLVDAELADKRVAVLANSYISNYNRLATMSVDYDSVSSQHAADSIAMRYNSLDSLNRVISQNISRAWSDVVDNKSFAYAMLIEKLGNTSIFTKEERLKIDAAKLVDSLQSQTVSRELLSYYATRQSLVELEYSVASALKLGRAVDSLRVVRDSLRFVEFNYPPITITPRLFIEYEPIKFSSKTIYNGANPIPNGKIYEQGVIYRLLVGSFKTRQAATLFRGAYPIYIIKNDAGMLSYYLGGYQTQKEADEAREVLLKRGFRRPIVVEWRDGAAPNHAAKKRLSNAKYRVEIRGALELSAELRSTITTQGAGRELSKVGSSTFVVGIFDDYKSAEHLMESLRIVDSGVSVSVIELK